MGVGDSQAYEEWSRVKAREQPVTIFAEKEAPLIDAELADRPLHRLLTCSWVGCREGHSALA